MSWAQCIIAILTYTEYKRTKKHNHRHKHNQTNQHFNIENITLDLNCPLLYNIEIYSMGIKCKCLLHYNLWLECYVLKCYVLKYYVLA